MSETKSSLDQNFDVLGTRFARNLYDAPKGRLRLQLVQQELLAQVPGLRTEIPLRILDVGCGLGQLTTLCASLGHMVVSTDISAEMIAESKQRLTQELVQQQTSVIERVQFVQAPLQDLPNLITGTFDLVIFHAVLEWLEHPQAGLQSVLPWLKADGILSLMFYNRHALVFKNLLRGHFRKIEQQQFGGEQGGLTPQHPLDPLEVEQWLQAAGMKIDSKRGIRCFFDYMDINMNRVTDRERQSPPFEDILRLEQHYGVIEPYRSLARYQLYHCRRAR